MKHHTILRVAAAVAAAWTVTVTPLAGDQDRPTGQGFSFRTGVELVNVTATVTDEHGRFVPGLTAADFEVYEDGKLQTISQFDSERVPVSLGIALDTSGSMVGEKIVAAQTAVNRFLYDLLGAQDEVFLYRFDSKPTLLHGWTEDRRLVGQALGNVRPTGGTAMYDTVAVAVPLAQSGTRRKKALVVISDGNDTSSQTELDDLRQLIRETEVMVYAIGIDASGREGSYRSSAPSSAGSSTSSAAQGGKSVPVPSPFPGRPPVTRPAPQPNTPPPSAPPVPAATPGRRSGSSDRLNVDALRSITDDSGGRTEIIVSPRDLDPATAGIANELSRQYFLGYSSSAPKDGRWHTIEVKVRRGNYTIRARRGFIAN
jgi:VWFA-related protein